ncbi:peptide chain release factor N(5)-glutamine methyltransferase [Algibacter sp. 2305UL17-15]|uniref:peptide chain release factor N(5)-glutamine methyltransferase n=1 Tax=Algibacter sp. 2305UL17-15 TaxID=3231268 RepID=UPI003457FB04
MKLKEIQNTFRTNLNGAYENEEIDRFFYLLIEDYYGVSRLQLAMNPGIEIENSKAILDALELIKEHKPIQYIMGETEFYGLPFKVNGHVLIPRPETEELVEWILNCHSEPSEESRKITILDIGTGSGCIAIALAKNLPNAKVYALDVSKDALKIAKQNAELNKVNIEFIEADILSLCQGEDISKSQKFDIIVSNPPYVRELEKEMMNHNVLDHEPHLALFVKDNNPLLFYEAISGFAKTALTENGQLFFEINEYLGKETVDLLEKYKFKNIELKQDIFGKNRMVKAEINS